MFVLLLCVAFVTLSCFSESWFSFVWTRSVRNPGWMAIIMMLYNVHVVAKGECKRNQRAVDASGLSAAAGDVDVAGMSRVGV